MRQYRNWGRFMFSLLIYGIFTGILFGILSMSLGDGEVNLFGVIPFDFTSFAYMFVISIMSVLFLNNFLQRNQLKVKKGGKKK